LSDCVVGALADRVQLPGPRSGTSTDSKPGARVPESAPLSAFAFDIGTEGLAVVVVALEKLLATDDELCVVLVVLVTFAVTISGTVVRVGIVVELGTRVVTGDVEEGGGDEAAGSRGADAEVRVKTSTSSNRGLDHIRRWALFSEKGERGIVFEG
jgi:hypothetical protein